MGEKEIIIVGGPNGAGKTTAARLFIPHYLKEGLYLNADEIARSISPDDPDSAALAAGRIFIERVRELVARKRSFAFETTCSGRSYVRLLEQCRQTGWSIRLLYFWLPSPDYSAERVARRVSEGGHNIPIDVIQRRYRAGISNMHNFYLSIADDAEIYDNSDRQRVLIARKRIGSSLEIFDVMRWATIEEISQ